MGKKRILITEDESIVAEDIKNKLEISGYDIIDIAHSGEKAVEIAEEKQPDLILMDIMLSGVMDGIEAGLKINESNDIPIIFLTAYSEVQLIERAKSARPYAYILKPFDERELFTTIEMTLHRHHLELKLKESEERYRRITDVITDYIYAVKIENGKLTQTEHSHACIAVTGYSREELSSDSQLWIQMVHEDERSAVLEQLENTVSGKPTPPLEHRITRKDGSVRWIRNTIVPYKDLDNKSVIAYDGLIQDITEKKLADHELIKSFEKLRKTLDGTVQAIALAVEARDPYTAGHQRRVANLAFAIATEMGLSNDIKDGIHTAGSIHDLGKISIPAEILSKPGKLTDIEFSLMKTHPQIGYDILKSIDFPWPVAQITYQHHERIDGRGYPLGLSSDEILIESKIMSVADVIEAMASHRPYRPGLGIDKAMGEITKSKGISYEETVVDACIELLVNKGYSIT